MFGHTWLHAFVDLAIRCRYLSGKAGQFFPPSDSFVIAVWQQTGGDRYRFGRWPDATPRGKYRDQLRTDQCTSGQAEEARAGKERKYGRMLPPARS